MLRTSAFVALLCIANTLASNAEVGPAVTKLAIGSSVNITIQRGVSSLLSLDTTSLNGNTTFLEVIISSAGSGQCFCNYSSSANPGWVSNLAFPAVFLLPPSLFAPNHYSNGTKTLLTFNETMGYCTATIIARLSPLIQLVPKSGLQAQNVQLITGGFLRVTMGSAKEQLQPFVLNISSNSAGGMVAAGIQCTFSTNSGSGVPCLLDTNSVPYNQFGGSGMPFSGPFTAAYPVFLPYWMPVQPAWQVVNITVTMEAPVPLAVNAFPVNASLAQYFSEIFTVPLSTTAQRNITITAPGSYSDGSFVYNAGDYAVVGTGYVSSSSAYSIILPTASTPNTQWLLVLTRTNPFSTPAPPCPISLTVA